MGGRITSTPSKDKKAKLEQIDRRKIETEKT